MLPKVRQALRRAPRGDIRMAERAHLHRVAARLDVLWCQSRSQGPKCVETCRVEATHIKQQVEMHEENAHHYAPVNVYCIVHCAPHGRSNAGMSSERPVLWVGADTTNVGRRARTAA